MLTKTVPAGALLPLYGDPPLTLVSGEGCTVRAADGREYLDFTAGIAVNALGYASPVIRRAIDEALESGLIHTSNLYRTLPGEALAETLVSLAFPGGVFFCNSGAEANEAALKFARRWAGATHGDGRTGFIAFRGSFHGRLFGTLAATDRPNYREPFLPVMPGVEFAEVGDLDCVHTLLARGQTAAVLIEPLQGEGGIRPIDTAFLRGLRAACDEHGVLLVFDEVQCGLGRTGDAFAYEHSGVVPDILTLAKPLGGGFPLGAVVANHAVGATLQPGDHATTFGGGPFVSTVAHAVVRTVCAPDFLRSVREKGERLRAGLETLLDLDAVREVRGRGLMLGLALNEPAAPVVSSAREAGLLMVGAGPDVVRLVPPLIVSDAQIDQAVSLLRQSIRR